VNAARGEGRTAVFYDAALYETNFNITFSLKVLVLDENGT
jgi:hypothetical protein